MSAVTSGSGAYVLQSLGPAREVGHLYSVKLVTPSGKAHRINFGSRGTPKDAVYSDKEKTSRRTAFLKAHPENGSNPLRAAFWTSLLLWGPGSLEENFKDICEKHNISVFGPVSFERPTVKSD